MNIIFEIIFAVVILLLGRHLWDCYKRDKFLGQVIVDESFLTGSISRNLLELENPPPKIALFVDRSPLGYSFNVEAHLKADRIALRRVKTICIVVLITVVIASYYMGASYLVANIFLLLLIGFAPVSEQAKASALEHVLIVAIILHKWHRENPEECEVFVEEARVLRLLYNVVKHVEGAVRQ